MILKITILNIMFHGRKMILRLKLSTSVFNRQLTKQTKKTAYKNYNYESNHSKNLLVFIRYYF